jgi:hypothetical protein
MRARHFNWLPVMLFAVGLWGCGKRDAAPETPPGPGTPAVTEALDGMDTASGDAAEEMSPTEEIPEPASETPDPSTPQPETPEAAPDSSEPSTDSAASGSASESPLATLACIGEDAAVAVLVRPSQIHGNPTVRDLIATSDEVSTAQGLTGPIDEFQEQFGVELAHVDHILLTASNDSLGVLPMLFGIGGPPGPNVPIPTVAVQLTGQATAEDVFSSIPASAATETEVAGKPARQFQAPEGVLCALDSQLLILGNRSRVEAIVNDSKPGPLAERMQSLAGRDLAIVLDVAPVRTLLSLASQQGPNPMVMMAMGLLQQVNLADVAIDLTGETLLAARLATINADSAEGIERTLTGLLDSGKQQFAQAKEQFPDEKEFQELQQLADRLVTGSRIDREGETVTFVLPRPEGMERLAAILKPAIEAGAHAAASTERRNRFKQIGLAFHNYHDVWNHIPAPDSNGGAEGDRINGGLSWRVQILPYVDAAPLYNRFKLDEPWDSEHNKALIPEMPKVFGDDPEGKSSVHLFVGEGTPFNMEKRGPSFREITDGMSNTLLVVEAGPDKAEIWTKPGGLPLDKEDPLAALGEIGEEFLALFMDGAVRTLPKTIDKEMFSRLIQHADGQPVELP